MSLKPTEPFNEEECSIIHALPVLDDNIVWIWINGTDALVVDPAVANPVKEWLKSMLLNLIAIGTWKPSPNKRLLAI